MMLLLAGSACTTMKLTPDLPTVTGDLDLRGRVEYEGSREYLPTSLAGVNAPASDGDTIFRYRYDVTYETPDVPPILVVLNPLIGFGFPTGSDRATVTGWLEVLRGNRTLKTYTASCVAKRFRTVYSGSSLSQLRRDALVAVRDSVDTQMINDGAALEEALNEEVSP
jgi:hypothetical protein